MGERDVSRNISSVSHQKNAKGLKNIGSLSLPSLFHLTGFFKEKILYFQCTYNKLNHSYANYLEDL